MHLSYEEIINLINKEKEKHQKILKQTSPQANKGYSRDAIFALRDFEKAMRMYLAKKYK